MWDFAYQARNEKGEQLSGTLPAESVAEAVQQLSQQGLEVTSIQRVDVLETMLPTGTGRRHERVDSASRHRLEQVIERRHDWLEAIESQLSELPVGPARHSTEQIVKRLGKNMTVEQYMRLPEGVDLLPLLASEESPAANSPRLHSWLRQIYLKHRARNRVYGRWSYPLVLLALMLALSLGWTVFILPVFRQMFAEFGLRLPAPTVLVFWLGDQLTIYALRTALVALVACAVFIPIVRWWRGRALTNRIFGPLVAGTTGNLRAMARLTRTLAELLGMELPLDTALHYAGQASGHRYFSDAAECQAASPASGRTDVNILASSAARLPRTVVYALSAGADGRPSVPVLRELAMIYDQAAQSRRSHALENVPAFSVVLIGIAVGFVVIALFMPLVSMITSLA